MSSPDGRKPALSLVSPEPDVAFYSTRAADGPGRVLVLGSAQGRIAWALATRGRQVLGVDPSERMVDAANAAESDHTPEVGTRVRFLCADFRTLDLREQFAVVLVPQNGLALARTRADLDQIFHTLHVHLQPGGLFILDALNPPPRAGWRLRDEGPSSPRLDPPRLAQRPHLRERRRAPGVDAGLRRLERQNGLTTLERYGNFELKPFEPSDAIQVVLGERSAAPA